MSDRLTRERDEKKARWMGVVEAAIKAGLKVRQDVLEEWRAWKDQRDVAAARDMARRRALGGAE